MDCMSESYLIQVGPEPSHAYRCEATETIIQGLDRQGLNWIKTGCRKGGCGACKVRLVEGQVSHGRLNSFVCSPEEQEEGYLLACQSRPKSDLILAV